MKRLLSFVFLMLLALEVLTVPSHVQSTTGGEFSKTATFGSSVTAGNTIICMFGTDASNNTSAVTDNDSPSANVYTQVSSNETGARFSAVWFSTNVDGGSALTITQTTSAVAGDSHSVCIEVSASADLEIDQNNTNDYSSTTTPNAGSITTAHADTIVVAAMRSGVGFTEDDHESGYTEGEVITRMNNHWKIFTSTATTDADSLLASAASGGGSIASFNEIAGAGGSVPAILLHTGDLQ